MMRRFPDLAALATVLVLTGTSVRAEYPMDRPIHVVLGFPAGGGADILGRWYVDKLREVSGATVILDNKPGAGGNLATDAVAKAKPDGYTILLAASAGMGGNRFIYKDLPFDSVKDFAPVTTLNQLGFVLSVNPRNPSKDVAELTQYLKAKNGKATYGWAVTSSIASAVLYVASEKIDAVPVNYKATGNAVRDVAAGEIDFTFSDMVFTINQERQGKVKILAVTSDRRAAGAPQIPTMAESGVPAATTALWWAMWVPASTPQDIIDRLEKWMNQVVAMPATRAFLISQGADPMPGNQQVMKEKLLESIEAWQKVTTIAKIKPQ